ncbi:MAG: sigma-70 family RNA polymerase sigma factor [Anaerolineales bacterium]|nr:sigma-70 family RNA polymerase sigma factor [Anaerolineales bacterium]
MAMTLSKRQSKPTQIESEAGAPAALFEASLETLFQQHWERLCRVLLRIVGDEAEAQDLALEAFVRLHRRPPADKRNLGGWLYRVATNLGLNALRARKRRQAYEGQAGALALEHGQPEDPAETVERALERQQVREALSAMRSRPAQALLLRHSGLSYAEVAAALGVASSSVGTLLARAESEFEEQYTRMNRESERRGL